MTTDLRFAIRTLFRRPIALAMMVISIGVGVGVNVAAHSVLRRLLVEPPVTADNPEQLITISPSVSYPQYEELKTRETRSALAASQAATLIWHDQSATTTVGAQVVSWNYFEVLRTRPLMGRTFVDGEHDPLRVVVTYAFWERSLHRDAGVLGRTLTINGWPFAIVAVLPRAFYSTVGPMAAPLLYVPISPHINTGLKDRAAPQFDLFGRLHDTATPEQAATAFRIAVDEIEAGSRESSLAQRLRIDRGLVGPLRAAMDGLPQRGVVFAILGAGYAVIGLVLVIACANVGGMLAARADERRREVAIRLAIGATRGRLARLFLAESLVISGLGSLAGLVLWAGFASAAARVSARAGAGFVVATGPTPMLYLLLLCTVATLICALMPLRTAKHVTPVQGLRPSNGVFGFRRVNVAAVAGAVQVAICFTFVASAALLLNGWTHLRGVEPGFDVNGTAILQTQFSTNAARGVSLQLKNALADLPFVEHVSYGDVPLGVLPRTVRVQVGPRGEAGIVGVERFRVGPGYLTALAITIVRGRDLGEHDVPVNGTSERSVVVNQTLASQFLDPVEPIGQTLTLKPEGSGQDVALRVVGVAADVRMRTLADDQLPVVYVPQPIGTRFETFVFRTRGPSAAVVRAVEQAIVPRFPGASITATSTTDLVTTSLLPMEIGAAVVGAVALFGLMIAMCGVYAIVSHSVIRRRFEVGVRVAIGATHGSVVVLLLREIVMIAAIGCLVGGCVSVGALTLVGRMVGFGAWPVAESAAAALTTICFSSLAAAWPVWKAARVEPIVVLRAN